MNFTHSFLTKRRVKSGVVELMNMDDSEGGLIGDIKML